MDKVIQKAPELDLKVYTSDKRTIGPIFCMYLGHNKSLRNATRTVKKLKIEPNILKIK